MKNKRVAWFVAATTSATMLVFIAAKVLELIPGATVIDVGAIAVTGILTGLFLGFGLTLRRHQPIGEDCNRAVPGA